jgi:hypothetical protein
MQENGTGELRFIAVVSIVCLSLELLDSSIKKPIRGKGPVTCAKV